MKKNSHELHSFFSIKQPESLKREKIIKEWVLTEQILNCVGDQLTSITVGCNEVFDNDILLKKCLLRKSRFRN